MLSASFAHGEPPPVTFETISKPGGVRVITHLSEHLAAEYRRTVVPALPYVEASLTDAVVAERVAARHASRGPQIVPTDLHIARSRARVRARELAASRAGPVILADVRACYGSMTAAVVERCLRAVGLAELAVPVRDVLERFGELGVPGLPIGPRASVVLANAILSRIDREIEAVGALHLRWVDDLAIFPGDRDPEAVVAAVAEALDTLGLSLAEEKCAIGPLTATRFGRSLTPRRVVHLDGSLG